ncbi:MAG: hypothetical protein IKJ29_01825 [Akkermansia sp.]|nr:hypothetical protein [Akkermansia sp.]
MKKLLSFLLVVIIAVLGTIITLTKTGHLTGIGLTAPVEISLRDSLLFSGKVVKVANTTKESPLECTLTVSTVNGDMTKSHNFQVAPGRAYEVGMVQMQWNFKTGEKVRVKAKGYLLPTTFQIP